MWKWFFMLLWQMNLNMFTFPPKRVWSSENKWRQKENQNKINLKKKNLNSTNKQVDYYIEQSKNIAYRKSVDIWHTCAVLFHIYIQCTLYSTVYHMLLTLSLVSFCEIESCVTKCMCKRKWGECVIDCVYINENMWKNEMWKYSMYTFICVDVYTLTLHINCFYRDENATNEIVIFCVSLFYGLYFIFHTANMTHTSRFITHYVIYIWNVIFFLLSSSNLGRFCLRNTVEKSILSNIYVVSYVDTWFNIYILECGFHSKTAELLRCNS